MSTAISLLNTSMQVIAGTDKDRGVIKGPLQDKSVFAVEKSGTGTHRRGERNLILDNH